MAKQDKTLAGNSSKEAERTVEQARGAMENYLEYFQKNMSTMPWGKKELNKKIQSYAGKNVATIFDFAQKLTKAKDVQELVQIQTEFMQAQLKTLSEQAKDLGEIATRSASEAIKRPSSLSS